MPDCPDLDVLQAFASTGATDEMTSRVAEHVSSCESCSRAFSAVAHTVVATKTGSTALDARVIVRANEPPSSRIPAVPIGTLIGRYTVVAQIGAGAMGVVYAARDPELDRNVAIKVVRARSRGSARSRLQREAKAIARLSDPNVVAVYDVGTFGGDVFLAMEIVEGGTLRE